MNFKPGTKVVLEKLADYPLMPASLADMTHNFTGSWRNMRPVIDYDKCINCGTCWKFCPEPAIYIEDNKVNVNYYFCKGCGICVSECPKKCITFEEEGK